jgi:hypothetical protein
VKIGVSVRQYEAMAVEENVANNQKFCFAFDSRNVKVFARAHGEEEGAGQ